MSSFQEFVAIRESTDTLFRTGSITADERERRLAKAAADFNNDPANFSGSLADVVDISDDGEFNAQNTGGLTVADVIAQFGEDGDADQAINALIALGMDPVLAKHAINALNVQQFGEGEVLGNQEVSELGGSTVSGLPPQDPQFSTLFERSTTRGGRGQIFADLLARSLGNFPVSPSVRRGAERQFNPLSARFALQGFGQEGDAASQDFRTFLQGRPSGLTSSGFQNIFDQIGPAFAQDSTSGLSPQQAAAFETLGDPEFTGVGNNIISEFIRSQGISPVFANALRGVTSRRTSALGDIDPDVSPFTQFARRGFKL